MGTPSCRSPKSRGLRHAQTGWWQRRLVIMVKAPVAGRVKTRLARDIGVVTASSFYRHATAALLARLANDPRWTTLLAVAPDVAARASFWPLSTARRRQGSGDLGQRMQRLFDNLQPGPVVIIGSDCPSVTPRDLADAFRALGRADVVLGPAMDGGYWLIGARRVPRPPRPFAGVRWSSATTLADTHANLYGHRVAMLRQLEDVDTAREWQSEKDLAARRVRSRL